jgi:hypothetical protein
MAALRKEKTEKNYSGKKESSRFMTEIPLISIPFCAAKLA